ncbi:hypothetical protein HY988_00620 [Candidatus Micrarchaeota archaeon]|nr:hypothetical protein [Candidatus Micrarchaeota archaeon]
MRAATFKLDPKQFEQRSPPWSGGVRAPFIDRTKVNALYESIHNMASEGEKDHVRRFFSTSPLDMINLSTWNREERIPRCLHGIDSPVAEFVYRLEKTLDCIDLNFFKSIEEYVKEDFAKLEFPGACIFVDQSGSTGNAHGKSKEQLDPTVRLMHLYFMVAMAPFRIITDTLIGDAVSFVSKAPNDNIKLSAIESARFLVTLRDLFRTHNHLVEMENRQFGGSKYIKLEIRGSMAVGDKEDLQVGINDNPIKPTAICNLMNHAARMNGLPERMGLVVNARGAELLRPYFKLKPLKIGEEVFREVEELEAKLGGQSSKPANSVEALEKFETLARLIALYRILKGCFEDPNVGEPYFSKTDQPFKTKMLAYWHAKVKLLSYIGSTWPDLLENQIVERESAVESLYSAEKYKQLLKLKTKGLSKDDFDGMCEIIGKKPLEEDDDAIPRASQTQKILHSANVTSFVTAVARAYGISPKTDFNLSAFLYAMNVAQISGSPTLPYEAACRATAVTLYTLEKLMNEAPQDRFLAKVVGDLIQRGLYKVDPNDATKIIGFDQDKLQNFIADNVVLPALLSDIGLLNLIMDNGEENRAERLDFIAMLSAKQFADFRHDDIEIRKKLLRLDNESRTLLQEINSEMEARGEAPVFSSDTLKVMEHINLGQVNVRIPNLEGDALDLIAEIVKLSHAVTSMRKPKAHTKKPALDWRVIDSQLHTKPLYPFVFELYEETHLVAEAA